MARPLLYFRVLWKLITYFEPFLKQILAAAAAGGIWAYQRHRQKTNVHIMALNLVRGVPLTPKEKETMLDVLTPPPPEGITSSFWWRRWVGR